MTYKCESCNKELSLTLLRVYKLIDESYKLKKINGMLIEFVKDCAQLDYSEDSFISENDQYVHDARRLLQFLESYKCI